MEKRYKMYKTFTLTFGDQAENHKGMQIIGNMAEDGFTREDLWNIRDKFEEVGVKSVIYNLGRVVPDFKGEAHVLVIKKGIEVFCSANDLFVEQDNLEKDKKAFMYGRVVNKHARHNLCFSEKSQEPDYENGKGRIVAFDDVPLLKKVRQEIPTFFGDKSISMQVEGNYYYDIKKCGIGFHGDSERKRVIGLRLGATMPLQYQWFKEGEPIGKRIEFLLEHGDMYVMSEKAVGTDWKKRNIYTLRHAAGCKKFLSV